MLELTGLVAQILVTLSTGKNWEFNSHPRPTFEYMNYEHVYWLSVWVFLNMFIFGST